MTTYPPFDQRDYLTPDEIDALAVCDWYSDGEGYAAFIAFDNHCRRPDEHQSADYEVCVHPDCVAARAAERKAYVEWQARNPETEVQP